MRKMVLVGRSGAGKTTLTQVLRGEEIRYEKTQYVKHGEMVIDTPGEYSQSRRLAKALALYTYEADVVGLLAASDEPYSLFPPCVAAQANREVIGIVTKIDVPNANIPLVHRWLEIAGCKKIFHVNSVGGVGVKEILDYLRRDIEQVKLEER